MDRTALPETTPSYVMVLRANARLSPVFAVATAMNCAVAVSAPVRASVPIPDITTGPFPMTAQDSIA